MEAGEPVGQPTAGREHEDAQMGVAGADGRHDIASVGVGQPEVGDQQPGARRLEPREDLGPGAGVLQPAPQQAAQPRIVLDQGDTLCRGGQRAHARRRGWPTALAPRCCPDRRCTQVSRSTTPDITPNDRTIDASTSVSQWSPR